MPTKTVIFTGLSKYDDATAGMRYLRTDEYIQMSGRAGRRGKDTLGTVIYLPEREPPSTGEMRLILKGGKPQIQSRMDFHYDFILKTFQAKTARWLEIQQRSYWYRQQQRTIQSEKAHLASLVKQLVSLPIDDAMREEMEHKHGLEEQVRLTSNAKRREAQRALDKWKDTHLGPKWANADTLWKESSRLQKEITSSETMIRSCESNQGNVDVWMKILHTIGFLDETMTLTKKGVLATEFNEGHGLLCAEMFTKGIHKTLTAQELVATLACFMEEKETDDTPSINQLKTSPAVRETLLKIDELVCEIRGYEDTLQTYSPESYWALTTTWIEPIWRWLEGESASQICADYGLFEGNFVRAVLRMANVVDEWTAVATFSEDVDLLEKLQGVRQILVRDFLIPDSLYLHL